MLEQKKKIMALLFKGKDLDEKYGDHDFRRFFFSLTGVIVFLAIILLISILSAIIFGTINSWLILIPLLAAAICLFSLYYYSGKLYARKYSIVLLLLVLLLIITGGVLLPLIIILFGVYISERKKPENERKIIHIFAIIGIAIGALYVANSIKNSKKNKK
jgi:hypothetical protein